MKKILIFVASGLSTRMGGFPKALSIINNKTIIEHAIANAKDFYDKIYIITNHKILGQFKEKLSHLEDRINIRAIITGKGDAESVLKSIRLVAEEEHLDNYDCTFCWGDAFFLSPNVFSQMLELKRSTEIASILVGCSIDKNPYAYFDIYTQNGNFEHPFIEKSYFKKRDGNVPIGMHDQCIFRCSSKNFIETIKQYQEELGYDGENYKLSNSGEMGLLNSFAFFNKIGKPAVVQLIPGDQVYSFNSQEELDTLKNLL